jgi:hypothetical protein
MFPEYEGIMKTSTWSGLIKTTIGLMVVLSIQLGLTTSGASAESSSGDVRATLLKEREVLMARHRAFVEKHERFQKQAADFVSRKARFQERQKAIQSSKPRTEELIRLKQRENELRTLIGNERSAAEQAKRNIVEIQNAIQEVESIVRELVGQPTGVPTNDVPHQITMQNIGGAARQQIAQHQAELQKNRARVESAEKQAQLAESELRTVEESRQTVESNAGEHSSLRQEYEQLQRTQVELQNAQNELSGLGSNIIRDYSDWRDRTLAFNRSRPEGVAAIELPAEFAFLENDRTEQPAQPAPSLAQQPARPAPSAAPLSKSCSPPVPRNQSLQPTPPSEKGTRQPDPVRPNELPSACPHPVRPQAPVAAPAPPAPGQPEALWEVEWRGVWYPARILNTNQGLYLVTYVGYGAQWDEWVERKRIRGANRAPAVPANGQLSLVRALEVEWNGSWYLAELLEYRDGLSRIHYSGFGKEWDEWVAPNRVRLAR